ncbi:hypothetical protein [Thermoactinomyces sp. DSM 45891]|nr:hypothetical protein [Thermoactinomyces sp. DSM 45891]
MTILAKLKSFLECADFMIHKPKKTRNVMHSQDFIEIMLNRNIR